MEMKPHVFLGPTLDEQTAKTYLPDAYYHPPIACGDLLRLLRLKPKQVVIIDGFYEFTPAVWHKEIMIAMDAGVEVWGAASMGALRASELHHFGMHGVGEIFEAFANGTLNDDDEVAVLHKSKQEGFAPLNDAMVNIRATLKEAIKHSVIDEQVENAIIEYCKAQFYPNRRLIDAISNLKPKYKTALTALEKWLEINGVIDRKRLDAIAVLQAINATVTEKKAQASIQTPMTKFINHLVDYSNTTPFKVLHPAMPKIEQALSELEKKKSNHFEIVADIALLLSNLYKVARVECQQIDLSALNQFIKNNHLYSPLPALSYLSSHQVHEDTYRYLIEQICLTGLTEEQVNTYLPAASAFYQLEPSWLTENNKRVLLQSIVAIILLVDFMMANEGIEVKKVTLIRSLGRIARARGYSHDQTIDWLNPPSVNREAYTVFISKFHRINCLYQGMSDLIVSPEHELPSNFSWLYDAFTLYQQAVSQSGEHFRVEEVAKPENLAI